MDTMGPTEFELGDVLFDEGQIRQRVAELAQQIAADYAGQELVLVGTLKGAFVFLADLMRGIPGPVRVGFLWAASYGNNTTSSGQVRLDLKMLGDIKDRAVLIVEDIVDTGRTLQRAVEGVRAAGPRSVKTCCLLDKPSRREVDVSPDYVGFTVPDVFVVGYGLDYAEKYRNLPYVAALRT